MNAIAIECPDCHGEGWICGILCDKCNGTRKIVIPAYEPNRDHLKRIALFVFLGIIALASFLAGWYGK